MAISPEYAPSGPDPTSSLRSVRDDAPCPDPVFEEATLETIADTVSYAAGAIGGLRDVLDRLDGTIAKAQSDRDADSRMGRLFSKAQDFISGLIKDAKDEARRITADAEAQAEEIIQEAREEAGRILDESRKAPGFAPRIMEQLQTTIEGFNRVNAELVSELASLRDTLSDEIAVELTQSVAEAPRIGEMPETFPLKAQDLMTVSPAVAQLETIAAEQAVATGPSVGVDPPVAVREHEPAATADVRSQRRPVTSDLTGAWMSGPIVYRSGRRPSAPRWLKWRTR